MKRFYILTTFFVLAVISASAQISKLFERYSDSKDVSYVYISKAMISMMPNIAANDIELKGLTDKLNNIRVLSTENADMVTKINKELQAELKKDSYEVLLSANDNGEKAKIYLKTDSKGINSYLIVAQEAKELSLVLISGTLTPTDVKKINI